MRTRGRLLLGAGRRQAPVEDGPLVPPPGCRGNVRFIAASATLRNAGSNPASYDAVTMPIFGTIYTGTVDLGATTGHNLAWLVGYITPLSLTLGGGQTILVNVADPNGELLTQPLLPGPIATYNLPVPSDIAFLGFTLSTQALHLGGVQPFALSNAQDLFLGD